MQPQTSCSAPCARAGDDSPPSLLPFTASSAANHAPATTADCKNRHSMGHADVNGRQPVTCTAIISESGRLPFLPLFMHCVRTAQKLHWHCSFLRCLRQKCDVGESRLETVRASVTAVKLTVFDGLLLLQCSCSLGDGVGGSDPWCHRVPRPGILRTLMCCAEV